MLFYSSAPSYEVDTIVISYHRGGNWSSAKLSDSPKVTQAVSREPRPVDPIAHVPNHQAKDIENHNCGTYDKLVFSCHLHRFSCSNTLYQPGDIEEFQLWAGFYILYLKPLQDIGTRIVFCYNVGDGITAEGKTKLPAEGAFKIRRCPLFSRCSEYSIWWRKMHTRLDHGHGEFRPPCKGMLSILIIVATVVYVTCQTQEKLRKH